MNDSIQVALLALLLLVANSSTCAVALGASPLNVYQSCVMLDGVSGQCRSQARVAASPSDAQAALELPIDMRLPCADAVDANRSCAENVDVAEVPVKAPGVSSCSVTLMPWSPFPCTYSTQAYTGVEGQNRTSWCYSQSTKPQERGYEHARDLVTDGYTNRFHGWLPDAPCGATTTSSSGGGASSPGSSKDGGSVRAAEGPGYGRHFDKVLLTLNFRVAAGRQFDRTYWFQIGRAVAAVGTLTEPTRWLGTDKRWSTTVDITHLQTYLAPGLPTRMSLANLLSNTYNVPLWAEATLQFYWTPQQETASTAPSQSLEAAAAGIAAVPQDAEPPLPQKAAAPAPQKTAAPTPAPQPAPTPAPAPLKAAAAAVAAAHVPDEVVPLVPSEDDAESMTVLAGQGDSPASWPRATFQLPAALSAPGNIYRAQLLVTPKADACEEFWAMNPSGAGTNNTCGGLSTGEPYREVRVYVNGQLAGFTPIYYTMYTGGVDPRLWSAIVASYTYNLPTYTFDLSPWIPQLNSQPTPSPSKKAQAPTSTGPSLGSRGSASANADGGEPAASRRLTQDSPAAAPPAAAAAAAGPQVPSVPPTTGSTPGFGAPEQQDHQQHHHQQQQELRWASAVGAGSQEAGHTITVELAGATGNGWIVGSTLLLWRAVGPDGQPQAVGGPMQVVVETTPAFAAPLASRCEPLPGASNTSEVAEAGRCTLTVRDRSMQASSTLQWQGHEWDAVVRYSSAKYDNIITYNNSANVTDGALTWYQETHHEATWSVTRRQPAADAGQGQGGDPAPDKQQQQQQGPQEVPAAAAGDLSGVLTQSSVKLDWLNSGVVAAGGVFEFSFNSTLLQPTVFASASLAGGGQAGASGGTHTAAHVVTGSQQHYQRALMLNVYTPATPKCVVPDNATHTVTLRSTLSSGSNCVRRSGTCGFCGARLMSNVLDWDC